MSLQELMRQRREKLARWRALGAEPYAYRYDVTHHAGELIARGDAVTAEPGERVKVAGRIMSLRGHGKAGFAHLLDGSGSIQLYFRADHLGDTFARYELLDVGDWIGVEGALFRTRTGEITIRADRFELLAKSLRPLPEKWHGLTHPETRFRQRYADLFMNLDVREIFRRRARLVSGLRAGLERACGARSVTYQGAALDFGSPWPRLSLLEAVSGKVGEKVEGLEAAQLERLCARHGIATRPGTGAGGLLDALFSELVQPELQRPTFVVDYPREVSPLARVKRGQPAVVERFEVFVAGMEIANAFSEQNDPQAQAGAFEEQMERRAAGDEEAQVMDHDYVRALEYGMPPTGGCGIGIDRLAMLATDSRSIREVILFPQLRPEEGRDEVEHGDAEAEPLATEGPGGTLPR